MNTELWKVFFADMCCFALLVLAAYGTYQVTSMSIITSSWEGLDAAFKIFYLVVLWSIVGSVILVTWLFCGPYFREL